MLRRRLRSWRGNELRLILQATILDQNLIPVFHRLIREQRLLALLHCLRVTLVRGAGLPLISLRSKRSRIQRAELDH